jgi:hypothetical protein
MRVRAAALGSCALAIALAAPARALNPGGGPKGVDCQAEFGGVPVNYPPDKPKEIRCTDGDPACDSDPTVGQCGILVNICLNVTDPALPTCIARRIIRFDVKNYDPTQAGYDPGFTTLRDEVRAMLPIEDTVHDVCTTDGGADYVTITIPLKVIAGKSRKATKTLHTHLDWALRNGHHDDYDTIRMTCLPPL